MVARTETVAAHAAGAVDELLRDPARVQSLARSFYDYLRRRAAIAGRPFDPCDDKRYLVARSAPWCDIATEEDGHGPWQAFGPIDEMLLAMAGWSERWRRATVEGRA